MSTTDPNPVIPRLQLFFAAALFATGGVAIKSCSFDVWEITFLRSLIAAATIFLLVPQTRRGWSKKTLIVALAHAATTILYVLANKMTTAASAIFLQSTSPLYLLLIGPLLLKEPITRRDVGFMAVLAVGIGFLLAGSVEPIETAPDPARGNRFAAMAGVSWALTVAGLRWLGKSQDSASGGLSAIVAGNALACVFVMALALPISSASASDWGLALYLGVFQIGLAYFLLSRGLRKIPALEASLFLYSEPVLAPLFAWMLLSENPGRWALVGGAIIISATAIKTWRDGRRSAQSGNPS